MLNTLRIKQVEIHTIVMDLKLDHKADVNQQAASEPKILVGCNSMKHGTEKMTPVP